MNRKGLVLKALGILFIVGVVAVAAAAAYFYFFFVFKEVKICISDELMDLEEAEEIAGVEGLEEEFLPECSVDSECVDKFRGEVLGQIDLPEFAKEKIDEVVNKAAVCSEDVCRSRRVYGDLFDESFSGECEAGDDEVSIAIRGKEGLQLIKFLGMRDGR